MTNSWVTLRDREADMGQIQAAITSLGAPAEPASWWRAIAADPVYPVWHRAECARQLLLRFVNVGSTWDEVAEIVEAPCWLSETDVAVVDELSGEIPIEWTAADTIVAIHPFGYVHGLCDPGVYMRVSGKLKRQDLIRGLMRRDAPISVLRASVLEIGTVQPREDARF